MKKTAILIVLALLIQFLPGFAAVADASTVIEKKLDGSISKITYTVGDGNAGTLTIPASSASVVNRELWNADTSYPYFRLILDVQQLLVGTQGTMPVNKGTLVQVRYAQSDTNRSRFVMDFTTKPSYEVVASASQILVHINGGASASTPSRGTESTTTPAVSPSPSPSPAPVTTPVVPVKTPATATSASRGALSWNLSGSTTSLKLAGTDLPALVAQGKASVENRVLEKTVHITIKGMDKRFEAGALPGNSMINGVLVFHNAALNITSIRISGKTVLTQAVNKSGTDSTVQLSTLGSAAPSSGTTTPQTGTTTGTNTSVSRGDTPSRSTPVQFSANNTSVTVTADNVTGSRVYRLGAQIVIEVPGVATADTVNVQSSPIRQVVGASSNGVVRLAVTTSTFSTWEVNESTGRLVVTVKPVALSNIEGGNDGDIVLRLTGTGIVDRYRQIKDTLVVDDDLRLNAFTFMFPSSVISLGTGTAAMNNTLAQSISVLSTGKSSFLSIAKRQANSQFHIEETADGNSLTIRRSVAEAPAPVATGGTLIMLDPGHGGKDPGAVFEGMYESHINLDIALRVEAILKQRGVNVQMTRRSDVFVGLEERAEMANKAKASIFVSIHNNSMPDPATRGTMTLYYPTSVNGKRYAEMLQSSVSSAVKLGQIGLRSSSQLIVLRKTHMPAVLTEVACMSNVDDMAYIKTSDFREKAAAGIADGIMKMLTSLK